MSPAPSNFSFSSQCAMIKYLPHRDGPISTGWNVSYSDTLDTTWNYQTFGSGTSAHRTTQAGATLQIDWLGSAIYLYGTSFSNNFVYTLDDIPTQISPNPAEGLLASSTGLEYGDHTAILTVGNANEEVSFQGMVLTVEVGNEGATIVNATQTAITSTGDGTLRPNPFFTYGNDAEWQIDTNFGNTSMATFTDGSKFFFTLQNTSAFFLIGTMNYDHNAFNVTLTPPVAKQTTAPFNDSSRWLVQNEVLYWQSGMDRDQTYTFQMENIGADAVLPPAFSFHSVVMMDAVDTNNQTAPSSNNTITSHHSLSTGAIAGIAIGPVAFLIFSSLAFYFLYFKRRRSSSAQFEIDSSPHAYQWDLARDASVTRPASFQPISLPIPFSQASFSTNSTVVDVLSSTSHEKQIPPPAYNSVDTTGI